MKYLIVGLGNVGSEYSRTRHNIGFDVLDYITSEFETSFELGRYGFFSEVSYKSRKLLLLKPNTFMNLSGKAVAYYMTKENIKLENLLVITDDISLPFNKLRLRKKGSYGGHNGLKSIEEHIKTLHYPRLRFGIGNNFSKGQQVSYVLGSWSNEEWIQIKNQGLNLCEEIVKSFVFKGIDRTMNDFNKR